VFPVVSGDMTNDKINEFYMCDTEPDDMHAATHHNDKGQVDEAMPPLGYVDWTLKGIMMVPQRQVPLLLKLRLHRFLTATVTTASSPQFSSCWSVQVCVSVTSHRAPSASLVRFGGNDLNGQVPQWQTARTW
jgi:hypothetical protein